MLLTIPEFEQLSEQQIFDMSVDHITKTGRPSMSDSGNCTYRGIGCAAAPFLTPEGRQEAGATPWEILMTTGRVPRDHSTLVQQLQKCHDEPALAAVPDESFRRRFADAADEVASKFNLVTESVEEFKRTWNV